MKVQETSLSGHLKELRRRIIWSILGLFLTTIICFIFHGDIIKILLLSAPSGLNVAGTQGQFVFVEVTEMLSVTFKVSLISGLLMAFPFILFQVILFVAPGLTSKERKYFLAFVPGIVLSFAAGAGFGYFVLIPPAINFLLGWGSDLATPMIRIGNYINVVLMLLFWMGVVFETPMVMFILAKLKIVSYMAFSRWRRYWIVVAFILGGLITPTFDPVNQSLVALPLILLYELGILLARVAGK